MSVPHKMITKFYERLKAIGIDIELSGNYPWIYLTSVNGVRVKEAFRSKRNFTAFFIHPNTHFSDRRKVFMKIREMVSGQEAKNEKGE